MPLSNSIVLFENENYGVRLEYNENFAIVHLPYSNKMTKEVFMDMRVKLEEWSTFLNTIGYNNIWAAVDPKNTKIVKLIRMLGFTFRGHSDGMSVYTYGGK